MLDKNPIIIVGGNGGAGRCLIQHLQAAGLSATVVSRRPMKVPDTFTFLQMDLATSHWQAPIGAIVISFLPLWIAAEFLSRFTEAQAFIATGSTSRFSKTESGDAHERSLAATLEKAEKEIQNWAEHYKIAWTILRPTLIYDCKTDKNITRMARFIERWHFLPVAAPAKGLRQPIHTDDVAEAAFKCIHNPKASCKAFNISGGDVLSYRTMAERVFVALGKKPRFVLLPTGLLQKLFRLAGRLRLIKETTFGASIFQRMNQDLLFDTTEGLKALDLNPRPFKPEFHFKD